MSNRKRYYDYRESIVVLLSGMYPTKSNEGSTLLKFYGSFTNSIFVLMITAGVSSLFQTDLERKNVFENVHYILVLLVVGSMRAAQLHHKRGLEEVFDFIQAVGRQKNTEIAERQQMRGIEAIHSEKSFLTKAGILWIVGFTLFTPVQGLITKNDDEPFLNKKLLNLPAYFVFLDDTPAGVTTGLVLFAVSATVTVLTVLSIFETYLSLSVQVETLFDIVSCSLDEIDNRALLAVGVAFDDSTGVCLKENIVQHQTINRYLKKAIPYLNRVFSVLALLASLTIATAGYMFTTEKLDHGDMLKYLASFCGEGLFTFYICQSAERIKQSSESIRMHLFWTPWHRYSIQNRKIMLIFMMCLRNPSTVQAKPFGIECSMENFYSLLRGTFSYMSLLKNQYFGDK